MTTRREFWQNIFNKILGNQELANNIETELYNSCAFKADKSEYEQKARQISINLDPKSYVKNTYLHPRVVNEEITPYQLVYLTPQELCPEKWEQTIRENKELLKKQVEGSKARATTDMFFCPKCKKRETTYYEQQTRGADEPMTKFITCVADGCGKQWKI
jgi:transcription elongation factor S-II